MKRYTHLKSMHAVALNFGMYILCEALHKFSEAILKMLWPKIAEKGRQFSAIKWPKINILKCNLFEI